MNKTKKIFCIQLALLIGLEEHYIWINYWYLNLDWFLICIQIPCLSKGMSVVIISFPTICIILSIDKLIILQKMQKIVCTCERESELIDE